MWSQIAKILSWKQMEPKLTHLVRASNYRRSKVTEIYAGYINWRTNVQYWRKTQNNIRSRTLYQNEANITCLPSNDQVSLNSNILFLVERHFDSNIEMHKKATNICTKHQCQKKNQTKNDPSHFTAAKCRQSANNFVRFTLCVR